MHPCSRLMTCPKYRLWTASDGLFLFTLRSTAPAAANADDAQSTRPHDKRHHSQMLYGCFLFCFVVSTLSPGASNTSCTSLFAHHSFFSPGRVVFRTIGIFHVVYCLYFFFVVRAVQSRCIHHFTPLPVFHAFCHPFMRYTFTFLYSPTPSWATF